MTGHDQLDLVLLAGGRGQRFGGPKHTAAVGPTGEALCEYAIFDALEVGFGRVVLVAAPDNAAPLLSWAQARFGTRIPVAVAVQEAHDLPAGRNRPWGTGHAALAAAEHVRGPFVLLNADDHYGPHALATLARFLRRTRGTSLFEAWAMVGFSLLETLPTRGEVSRAIGDRDEGGHLVGLHEHRRVVRRGEGAVDVGEDGVERPLSPHALVSLNAWGFTPVVFDLLREDFARFRETCDPLADEFHLPAVVSRAVEDGKASVRVLAGADEWFGLTHAHDVGLVSRRLQELIAAGRYPPQLWR